MSVKATLHIICNDVVIKTVIFTLHHGPVKMPQLKLSEEYLTDILYHYLTCISLVGVRMLMTNHV